MIVTALIFLAVLELVRRRYLAERYALLWMIVAGALLVLAIWTDLLAWGTDLLNIEVPANGLFLAAFAVAFLLLLHFSVATSRLSEQTKILAQEVARLDGELRAARARRPAERNGSAPAEPQQAEGDAPVGRRAGRPVAASAPPRRGMPSPALGRGRRRTRAPRPSGATGSRGARASRRGSQRITSSLALTFCPNQPPASETATIASSVAIRPGTSTAISAAG